MSASGSRSNAIPSRRSLAEDAALATPEIVERATATIKAGLGGLDAKKVWAALGLYVESQLLQRKTVRLDAFGDFGVDGSGEPVFRQDPAFLQMTRLRLSSRKNGNRSQSGSPTKSELVVGINMADVTAVYLPTCSKAVAHSVIASVLAWVNNWAKEGRQLELDVLPLGKWVCDGESVEFRFSAGFHQQLILRAARVAAAEAEAVSVASGTTQKASDDNNQRNEPLKPVDTSPGNCTEVLDTISTSKPEPKRKQCLSGLLAPTLASLAKQRLPTTQQRLDVGASARVGTSRMATSMKTGWLHPRQVEALQKSTASCVALPTRTASSDTNAHAKKFRPHATANGRDGHSTSKTTAQHKESRSPQSGIIDRIRSRFCHRREHNIQGLNSLSSALSDFKMGAVLPRELSLLLRRLGVKVSAAEMKTLTIEFPHRKRGHISARDFLDALRGPPLSANRLDVVARAFHRMDPECGGAVTVDVLRQHYDVSFLPEVRAGTQTQKQALSAFLQEWEASASSNNGKVTFEAFVGYYHNVSAFISEDSAFERLMRLSWHVSKEEDHKANSTLESTERLRTVSSPVGAPTTPDRSSQLFTKDLCLPEGQAEGAHQVLGGTTTGASTPAAEIQSHPDESAEAWAYLRKVLLSSRNGSGSSHTPALDDLSLRLSANRILGDGNETMNTKAFAHALTLLDKRLQSKRALALAQRVAHQCADPLSGSDTIELTRLYRVLMNDADTLDRNTAWTCGDSSVATQASKIIQSLRTRVLTPRFPSTNNTNVNVVAGPLSGLNALERSLQWASLSHDNWLSKQDLRLGLQKVGIDISFHDLDYLFAHFDTDRQGCITSEVVLEALRGPVNSRRLALIHKAFDLIAGDASNTVALGQLTAAYDPSKLPDVVNGTLMPLEAAETFGLQWGSTNPDSVISRGKFESHFKNVSAAMESDTAFETMMRGVWCIPTQWTWLDPSTNAPDTATGRDLHQTPAAVAPATSHFPARRRKQPVRQSHQRNFHRQSLVHRAIWKQPERLTWFQWETEVPTHGQEGVGSGKGERAHRNEAAQRIQLLFRAFRSRRIAMQLRRKAAAQRQKLAARMQERTGGKKAITRPALAVYH